ncbi:MAG: EAL domain-containing protein [Haliea sp.]|uniref:putative bifunctional diguanylate cyclase/phosphodiesterase n=1 Tax=Haliea sp. TaxID=1932666 RepID=UPI0032EACF2D
MSGDPGSQDAQAAAGYVMLAVDDDPGSLLLAETFFASEGYTVATALSGADALARIDQIAPDIILLDIIMPGMDGFEVCRQIRRRPKFKNTPIIVLTSLNETDAEQRAFSIGAWDFVSKPVNWSALAYRAQYALRAASGVAVQRSADRFARVINQSPDEILVFTADTHLLLDENMSALRNLGYSKAELQGMSFTEVLHNGSARGLAGMLEQVRLHQQEKFSLQMRRKDGSVYPTEGTLLYSEDDDPSVFIAILQDTSERQRIQQELHRLAHYDEMTGLANRRLLEQQAVKLLSGASRQEYRCAVCMLDLDGIRHINDTLGPAIGDSLIREVSSRLASAVRPCDLVARDESLGLEHLGMQLARFGGDEFVVVLSNFTDPLDAARVADRILATIAEPCDLPDGGRLSLTASMGISVYPDDGDNFDVLVQRAHTAMFDAKQSGRNRYAFYTEAHNRKVFSKLQLESELRAALKNQEFELHFQPLVDSARQRVVGAECLLRWRHPSGLRYPDAFIPLAEETGLILPLGDWILEAAVNQLSAWAGQLPESFDLSINVSALQVRDPVFLQRTREVLAANPDAARNLVFELTESSLVEDLESTASWLHELRALGVRIAIDDFGTGYSSLNYLVRLPVHTLKIDRMFVAGIEREAEQAAVVSAIFQMARALRLEIVVEGVETPEQLQIVAAMGSCDVQGWLISKALTAAEFGTFLDRFPTQT